MARADAGERTPHLFSALIACALTAAILWAGRMLAVHLEHSTLTAIASQPFSLKNQGLVFQRAAVRAPNVLPMYGSSELIHPIPDRSSDFFRTAPTGFQVSPVGKAGSTSMIILEKLGGLGTDLRGKRVAISLSPSWFFAPVVNPHSYEGNFSLLAASEMVFGGALDCELKRDIASRMLQFPHTRATTPLLALALERLASSTWLDRVVFYALWPMGKTQNTVLDLQDHFEALVHILREAKPALPRHPEMLDWVKLIAEAGENGATDADKKEEAAGPDDEVIRSGDDAAFLARMDAAREWIDFELLLRVLSELHARPLLLSMPINGLLFDHGDVSRSAHEAYYKKVRVLAQRYDFPLIEFEDHDNDPAFFDRHKYHLSAKGWMFYNRALDDFFHGRDPEDPTRR
jgi:D-alanine transfer protein